jgi:hypothetical protein
VAPITEVGYGMKATHSSCSSASHIMPSSKRLMCWNRTLCPTRKLAMNREAGQEGENFRPGLKEALQEFATVQIRRRLGQDQLYGEQGQGYRVDAVAQEDQTLPP